jgi:hypothetical protein
MENLNVQRDSAHNTNITLANHLEDSQNSRKENNDNEENQEEE